MLQPAAVLPTRYDRRSSTRFGLHGIIEPFEHDFSGIQFGGTTLTIIYEIDQDQRAAKQDNTKSDGSFR